MHKFMRTVGFSMYQKKRDMEALLKELAAQAVRTGRMAEKDGSMFCELRAELADDMGVVLAGEMDEEGNFSQEYYFPYVKNTGISSAAECSIQRHAEKETYAGLLDEYRVGISLIFYMENSLEYRLRRQNKEVTEAKGVSLTGLAVQGKILLPVQKTRQQAENSRQESKKRTRLIEAAKNGDEDAIETLTIEDIDMYSQISRRVMKEDLYSIIDSCFMPCGIECDQYSVIGEITEIVEKKNQITGEDVYDLKLECSDIVFHVGIAKQDLTGEPAVGRRFKGQIWMQGNVVFDEAAD